LAFEHAEYDLCILDVMMPRKDGFAVAQEIRKQNTEIPILFLTARNLLADKMQGFGLGGDDYLTKPFSMEELLLRIKALLRRRQGSAAAQAVSQFQLGKFSFDYVTRQLQWDDGAKRLTSREAELLRLLCLNMNQVLKRQDALLSIWGDDSYFNARSMDVFITKLRKYLKADPALEIMNVHGMGYKLIVVN
ncbi:MAG TPA: response regulator transcription factor, partial [Bacteroidetes bacterium]|nr:response regulator transcription factor [Bacteroidota bacterium]